jgi:hypothetical protein
MADVKISALPAGSAANPADEFPANQAGTTRKLTFAQLMLERHRIQFASSDFVDRATTVPTSILTTGDYGISAATGGGSVDLSSTAGLAQHPGIATIKSAATANTGGWIGSESTAILLSGGESYEAIFNIATLVTPTIRMGFLDSVSSTDAVDGVYIEIPSSGNAVGKTANNSTRSTTGTNVALSTGTWYRARIDVNSDATQVDFYIFSDAGVQLWHDSLTTNIPTATGRETAIRFVATNGDAAAITIALVDYMANWKVCTRG